MEAGQGDELELVAHLRQRRLEARNGRVVQLLLPVERRRAVVGQQLAGELRVDGIGKAFGFLKIRLGSLAPDQVGVGRVGQAARDGRIQPAVNAEEAFAGAFAGAEDAVVRIDVAGQQDARCWRRCAPGSAWAHPRTSAASRAATNFCTASCVGTSTLPPRCPHFFADDS